MKTILSEIEITPYSIRTKMANENNAFKRPSVTVDLCVFRLNRSKINGLLHTEILLIKRKRAPFQDMWAIPGGFLDLDKNETLLQAACRELKEETGADVKQEQLGIIGVYDAVDRDPRERVISHAFFKYLSDAELALQTIEAADDAYDAMWFDVCELPQLAFDHADIINDHFKNKYGKSCH